MRRQAATPRHDIVISFAEYDAALAREIATRLGARLRPSWGESPFDGDESVRSATLGAPWPDASAVVVLHGRMWGQTPVTRSDRAAISGRCERDGAAFLYFVHLDDTPSPVWAAEAQARHLDDGIDAIAEWLAEAVPSSGGTGAAPAVMLADDDAEHRTIKRDAFLGSSRALPIFTREFERLTDDIAERVASADTTLSGAVAEVRRTPRRCIVQLGPVALTVSWIRDHADTVAAGRLLVAEWRGIVARGAPGAPERARADRAPAATLLREVVLMADATGEPDWRWRPEQAAHAGYASPDLAALCVDSLLLSLAEHGA